MKFDLERWMQERHISQTQLASGLGITKQAVNNWLASKSIPNTETLEDLCLFLDVPIDKLLILERASTRTGKTWRDFPCRFAA